MWVVFIAWWGWQFLSFVRLSHFGCWLCQQRFHRLPAGVSSSNFQDILVAWSSWCPSLFWVKKLMSKVTAKKGVKPISSYNFWARMFIFSGCVRIIISKAIEVRRSSCLSFVHNIFMILFCLLWNWTSHNIMNAFSAFVLQELLRQVTEKASDSPERRGTFVSSFEWLLQNSHWILPSVSNASAVH